MEYELRLKKLSGRRNSVEEIWRLKNNWKRFGKNFEIESYKTLLSWKHLKTWIFFLFKTKTHDLYRQRMNNIHKWCQVIWGELSHLEVKNDCWNSLKIKQIQKLAVMPTWTCYGRPTGRPPRHSEKSRWLRSTASYIKKEILNCRSTGPVDQPKQRARHIQSGDQPVDRRGWRSTDKRAQMCTPSAKMPGRPFWPVIAMVDRPVDCCRLK